MARVLLTTIADEQALGVRILGSALEQAGHKVKIIFFEKFIDCMSPYVGKRINDDEYLIVDDSGNITQFNSPIKFFNEDNNLSLSLSLYEEEIINFKPDIIGFSGRSFFDKNINSIFNFFKKCVPNVIIVSGGFGPTFSPESYLDIGDYVIIGEGENSIVQIATAFDKKNSFETISNICYKNIDGRLTINPLSDPVVDLNKLPYPLFNKNIVHIFSGNKYYNNMRTRAYYTLAGRGCLMSCSYCSGGNWPKLYHENGLLMPKRRRRNLDNVIAELLFVKKQCNYNFVHFCDEHFAYPKNELINFFKIYKKLIGIPFFLYLHAAQITKNPDILRYACDAGLAQASLGIQTGDENFASKIFNRKNQNSVILECANLFKDNDVACDYQFIMGSPFDTDEKVINDFYFCSQLPFLNARTRITVFYFTPHKGSPIFKYLKQGFKRQQIEQFLYNSILLCLCRYYSYDFILDIYKSKKYYNDISYLRSLEKSNFNNISNGSYVATAHSMT